MIILLRQIPIPFLTSPLKGEEYKDFPPFQGEACHVGRTACTQGQGGGGQSDVYSMMGRLIIRFAPSKSSSKGISGLISQGLSRGCANGRIMSKALQSHDAPEAGLLKPQVCLTKNLVLKQLLAGSFGDDLPRGEDIVAGGHLKDRADLLFNEQDGDP